MLTVSAVTTIKCDEFIRRTRETAAYFHLSAIKLTSLIPLAAAALLDAELFRIIVDIVRSRASVTRPS